MTKEQVQEGAPKRRGSFWRLFMLIILSFLFTALNLTDLLTTLFLINRCQTNVEGNPLANVFYQCGGAFGMTSFKLLITAFVVCVAFYIYRRKPVYSYLIMGSGCTILTLTILYTLLLFSAL